MKYVPSMKNWEGFWQSHFLQFIVITDNFISLSSKDKAESQCLLVEIFQLSEAHCIKNKSDSVASVVEITAWAQEHFHSSVSVNTVHCTIENGFL